MLSNSVIRFGDHKRKLKNSGLDKSYFSCIKIVAVSSSVLAFLWLGILVLTFCYQGHLSTWDSCWIAIHHVLSCCLEGTKKWNRRVACCFQPIQLPSSNLFESPIQDFHLHLIGKNLVLWLRLAAKEVGKFRNFVTKEEAIGGIFWKTCPCFTNMVALEALF